MLEQSRKKLLQMAGKIAFLGPLLARLTVGVVFVGTGWGKIHDLPKVAEFFEELHIPAPHFQAGLVATTELVGGALILVGLLTRLAALPLAFTMVIAILTAKLPKVEGITDLFGFEEVTYLVIFLWIALAGPGPVSLDWLISKRWFDEHGRPPHETSSSLAPSA
jgi:putative oxidoreductase